jgi:hypothetical protein
MDSEADRFLKSSAVASGGIVFISYPPLERSKVHLGVVASESALEQPAEPDEARATLWVLQLAGILWNALCRLAQALRISPENRLPRKMCL